MPGRFRSEQRDVRPLWSAVGAIAGNKLRLHDPDGVERGLMDLKYLSLEED